MTNLFINSEPGPHNTAFEQNGTDTLESFTKNKKKLGKDWYYYDKQIEYSYNEQGFRNKSFNDVKWEDSIVFFGCSNVAGTGHLLEDTMPYKLEQVLGIPVVNMGISGGGVDIACWNSLILHDHYPHPKAIVHMWTGLDRYADFFSYRKLPKTFHPSTKNYCARHDWSKRSKLYIKADNALWKNKTNYYQCTMFGRFAEELQVDFYDELDSARDMYHPGVESYQIAVEGIAENLIKLGVK